ncbi:tetratricopeptide repeat protein [Polaribacter sp. M15]
MSLTKFESMLKTNSVYFFDLVEFEEIIIYYLDAGKHSLAKKAVSLGLEQHPQSIDLKLLQVELFIFENELDKASHLLKRIEHIAPNNDEVFIQKATIASKSGNHLDAIEHLKKALSFAEDKVDVWSLMGMEYLYLDDFENARVNFTKCIAVDYEDYSALYNIVYCFDMQKEHQEAINYLNTYIDKNPYCEVAWHQLGRQHFILNQFKEALIAFDYAVLIDEHFIGGYLEKAKTLEALGEYEEAIENYRISLELDDPTAYAYVRVGECYEQLKNYEAAISYYKKAVHEDPLLDRGWILLTNLYYNDANYEKASYYISKAIKIDEDNAMYWRRYSDIKIKLRFYEDAAKGLKRCLALKDDALEVYITLTDVLCFLGDFNTAISVLFTAQKIYKNFAEIEYRLAGLFFMLDKQNFGLNHLITAMHVDYEYHIVLNELFPTVYENPNVQKLLVNHKTSLE